MAGYHNNPLYDDEDPDEDAAIGYESQPWHTDEDDWDNPPCPCCGERGDHETTCTVGALIAAEYWAEEERKNEALLAWSRSREAADLPPFD